ncbi:MAG: Ribosome-binding factor A [Firmicutes bacterium]|nr:Ribosome-binding factor A [Bacillota bacterium]MBT9152893.1 Ribosome-binding factor A [Bacillota bacterium]
MRALFLRRQKRYSNAVDEGEREMPQFRTERIKGQLKEELSDILRLLKDPRLGFATITSVELSGDHRHVKAFVSVFGTDEEKKDTLKALESATGFIRTEVGKRIKMRHTPEVIFRIDESIEHGAHINKLLKDIERDNK